MPHAPGDLFAGYTILRLLGRGGMATVYLAQHPNLPRQVALKLLNRSLLSNPSFRLRFEREADMASDLFHRNIVTVLDRGEYEGQLWIAFQYINGTDAEQELARDGNTGFAPPRAVHIVTSVSDALSCAHDSRLLHRDVKPSNILLAPPRGPNQLESVYLSDFGISKLTEEASSLTGTGNLIATFAYVSPEQIQGHPLDHRVDIYSLGCVLFELLTGSKPFPGTSTVEMLNAHLNAAPPRPSRQKPDLVGFDAVIAKAMAKDPNDRFQTAHDLADAAHGALAARPVENAEKSLSVTVLQPWPPTSAERQSVTSTRGSNSHGRRSRGMKLTLVVGMVLVLLVGSAWSFELLPWQTPDLLKSDSNSGSTSVIESEANLPQVTWTVRGQAVTSAPRLYCEIKQTGAEGECSVTNGPTATLAVGANDTILVELSPELASRPWLIIIKYSDSAERTPVESEGRSSYEIEPVAGKVPTVVEVQVLAPVAANGGGTEFSPAQVWTAQVVPVA